MKYLYLLSRSLAVAAPLVFAAAVTASAQSDDLVAKSRTAKQAMAEGRFADAIPLYQELVQALPQVAGMRMNLGLALHSAGRYREAIPQFDAALKQQPELHQARLLIGLAHLKLEQPAQAIAPLQAFVKAVPGDAMGLLELGGALLATHRTREAIATFRALTELHPESPNGWQGLGLAYAALGQHAFEQLEKLAPGSAYADVLFARSLATRGRHLSAFKIYRDATAKAPSLRGLHAEMAALYRATGHPDWAAIEDGRERALPPPACASAPLECDYAAGRLRELIDRSPQPATASGYYFQALACASLSEAAFAQLDRMPPSAAIHDLLAEAYRIQGKMDLAAAEWEKATALAPQDRRLRRNLARALSYSDAHERARALADEVLRAEPDSPDLNFLMGEVLVRADAFSDAVPYLEKALKGLPQHVGAHAALGAAYMQLGRPKDAIPHLEAALDPDPEGKTHYQLSQAYRQTGQTERAAKMLAEFSRISKETRAKRQLPELEITPP